MVLIHPVQRLTHALPDAFLGPTDETGEPEKPVIDLRPQPGPETTAAPGAAEEPGEPGDARAVRAKQSDKILLDIFGRYAKCLHFIV